MENGERQDKGPASGKPGPGPFSFDWIVARNLTSWGGLIVLVAGLLANVEALSLIGVALVVTGETWMRDLAIRQWKARR